MDLHVYFHFALEDLAQVLGPMFQNLKDDIMSALSDKIAEATTHTDAAIGRVQADVTALTQKIAELQALVDAGGASPADMAALDALITKVDALDPTKDETLPGGSNPTDPTSPNA